MRKLFLKLVAAFCIAASLGACAQGARTNAMVAPLAESNILPANDPLVNSAKVGRVIGGTDTSPLWKSEISNFAFEEALEQSLRLNTILGDDGAPLTIDANLLSVEQPFIGASMTVTTSVQYTVTNSKGAKIFDEIVTTPFTAAFSDAFIGAERLRLANEGSAQANIASFIDKLIATSRAAYGTS